MNKRKSYRNDDSANFPVLGFVLGLLSIVSVFLAISYLFRDRISVKEDNLVPKSSILNARQKKIFSLLKNKGEVTIEEIMDSVTGVSERTLRRDMSKLESLGYSKKVGMTKGTKYIFVA